MKYRIVESTEKFIVQRYQGECWIFLCRFETFERAKAYIEYERSILQPGKVVYEVEV